MAADELNALADAHPACRVAAFADLAAGMVLVASGHGATRREALDELCAEGRDLFAGSGGGDGPPDGMAIAADARGVRLFLRGRAVPDDMLCCDCTPDLDLAAFLPAANACLDSLSPPDDERAAP